MMLILFISYFSLRPFFISFPPCGMEKNSLSKQAYVAWNDMWFPHVLDQQVSRVFIYLCFAPAFRGYTKRNWRKASANCCLFKVLNCDRLGFGEAFFKKLPMFSLVGKSLSLSLHQFLFKWKTHQKLLKCSLTEVIFAIFRKQGFISLDFWYLPLKFFYLLKYVSE